MTAKPVKTHSDTEWQFVDIFLFSNGQHKTPPRKYHLSSEDLNSWNKTLKNLAECQYEKMYVSLNIIPYEPISNTLTISCLKNMNVTSDRKKYQESFSSIDLYTVDGEKIKTPMQVNHGGAYVAVPPQDTFIAVGYNDYLLKASRSREKRHTKSNNINNIEQGNDIPGENNIQIKEENELKILSEERDITATSTIADQSKTNPKRQMQNSEHINVSSKLPIKSVSNIKNPVAISKNTLSTSQLPRRTSLRNKDSTQKKYLKVNTLNGATNGSMKFNRNNNLTPPITEKISKMNKLTERATASKIPREHMKLKESLTGDNPSLSIEKNVVTEETSLDNIITDKELIVFKTNDSEIATTLLERDKNASALTRATKLSSVVPLLAPIEECKMPDINKEEATLTVVNNIVENIYQPDLEIDNVATSNNKTNLLDVSFPPESDNQGVQVCKITPKESFVAVIDKGDIINLNLKIELRKAEGVVNTKHDTYPKQINSLTEKCSQVDVDPLLFQPKINLPNPTTDSKKIKEENANSIVVHCTCCSHHNLNEIIHRIDTTCVPLGDKKYVLILPSRQPRSDLERCECELEINKTNNYRGRNSSVDSPVNKVYADTSLDVFQDTSEDGKVTTSKIEIWTSKDNKYDDGPEIKRKVSIVNMEKSSSKQLTLVSSQVNTTKGAQNTGSVARKSILSVPKVTVDNNAQTEWCSILVEARLHKDNRYSFHLPPLQTLKYYGLI